MNPNRKTAIIVGVLFIIATVFSLIGTSLIGSVIGTPDYLINVSANKNQVISGVLFLLAAAASVILIPAMMFPILKQHNEGIALGYFGLRIIEAVTFIVDAVSLLLLISLSQEYVKAGVPAASYFQTSGALLLAAHNWAFPLNPIVFGLGPYWSPIGISIRLVRYVRRYPDIFGSSNSRARNGFSSMADR